MCHQCWQIGEIPAVTRWQWRCQRSVATLAFVSDLHDPLECGAFIAVTFLCHLSPLQTPFHLNIFQLRTNAEVPAVHLLVLGKQSPGHPWMSWIAIEGPQQRRVQRKLSEWPLPVLPNDIIFFIAAFILAKPFEEFVKLKWNSIKKPFALLTPPPLPRLNSGR